GRLASRFLHHRREPFHALQALLRLLAPEVEDQLAHAEARVGADVVDHLIRRAGEGPPQAARGLAGIVQRRLVGDRQSERVAALGLREPAQLVEQGLEFRRRQHGRRVGADGMPAVAVTGGAAERGAAVTTDPDRRGGALRPRRRATETPPTGENAPAPRRGLRPPPPLELQIIFAPPTPATR